MHAGAGEKCKKQDITVAESGKFQEERTKRSPSGLQGKQERQTAPHLRTGVLFVRHAESGDY